jgi:branched-chain amino acid transport system substrate-binding protein
MKSVIRAAAGAAIALSFCVQAQQPVRIGSTLSLTGPLGPTSAIHKVAGDVWIDEINRKGGLLGRKVEWLLKDDQSRPDLARTLYEQIITVDKVDLIIGPYATANILSAMGVAQRYNKLILHNSFGTPRIVKYDLQFPTSGGSGDPENAWPNLVFDAAAAAPRPPKTVAIVTSKFPSLHFISVGTRDIAKKRGLNEVLWLEWEFGNREFGPIASRIKDAKPDFVFVGATGLDAVMMLEAMKKIDYQPPMHFYMFPSPGPTAKVAEARGAMAFTTFEEHAPFTSNPRAAQFVTAFHERAKQAGLPDTAVDLHASIAYSTWQTLEAAVNGAKSLDDKAMAQWLRANPVETIMGRLSWPTTPDGPPNYMMGKDIYKVKQLQDGKWVVVWPKEFAAPGAKLQ